MGEKEQEAAATELERRKRESRDTAIIIASIILRRTRESSGEGEVASIVLAEMLDELFGEERDELLMRNNKLDRK